MARAHWVGGSEMGDDAPPLVRELTTDWLDRYNTQRPHDSLGHVPPLTHRPRSTALSSSISKLLT
jgi:putative transposase